jgi:tetratricopeptide (TPR) repeat protein
VDPDTEAAQRHFKIGSEHYEASRYREAIGEFEIAYKLKPLPELHYNIGRCYDRLEEYPKAVEHYEAYLKSRPNIVEVQERVTILKARLQPVVAATPPPPEKPKRRWVVWTAIGVTAVVVVGVGLGVGLGLGLRSERAPMSDLGTFEPVFP